MSAQSDSIPLEPSAAIRRKLAGTRWALVGIEVLRRSWWTLAVAIVLFGALLAADLVLELDPSVRRIGLIVTAVVVGVLALWTVAALITARRGNEEIALMVERRYPEFDSRLISAVQFGKKGSPIAAGNPETMAKASLAEAEKESRRTAFLSVSDPRHGARAALALLAALAAFGTWAALQKDTLPVLVARAFGADTPLPRETRITGAPGEALIGIGDPIELAFTAEGVLPEQGELTLRYESGRREKAPLVQDETAPGRYLASIDDVPESFTFTAEINDASTGAVAVTALERPAVLSIAGTQTYPAFTGLAPTEHTPGDFTLLPGSQLQLEVGANKPLASARLHFVGTGEELPLEVSGNGAGTAFTVPRETLGGFTVALIDNNRLESTDGTVYRVTSIRDRPPEIRITYPRRAEELVTRRARVLLRYTATDRFGIAAVALRHRRGDTDDSGGSIPIEIPADNPKAIEGEYEWDLTALQPPAAEGETIEYWFEATDQNTGDDRVGRTEKLRVKVVTAEEKRADLLGRASDTLGGVGAATDDQQQLNTALERLIREAAGN